VDRGFGNGILVHYNHPNLAGEQPILITFFFTGLSRICRPIILTRLGSTFVTWPPNISQGRRGDYHKVVEDRQSHLEVVILCPSLGLR
jgi:hypothetical protein